MPSEPLDPKQTDKQEREELPELPAMPADSGGPEKQKPPAKSKAKKKPPVKKQAREKRPGLLEACARPLGRNPVGHAIGQFFYQLGFYAECKVVWFWRGLRVVRHFVAQIAVWLFGGILRTIGRFIKGLWRDLTEPFRRLFSGVRSIRRLVKEEKKKGGGGEARKKALGYFGSGVRSYGHLLGNLLRLALPVAAGAVFLFTVYTMLSLQYVLAVSIEGEVVGYIADEATFEDARAMLRERIVAVGDRGAEEWQITPQLTIATATSLTTKPQLVNNILSAQNPDDADALVDAFGIRINGDLRFITTDIETIDGFLHEYLQSHYDENDPDAQLDYVQEIEYDMEAEDLFYRASVDTVEEILATMTGVESERQEYTANGAETLSEIAWNHDLSLMYLLAYNPDYVAGLGRDAEDVDAETVPPAGTVLVVQPQRNFLQVSKTYVQYREVETPYDTVEEENPSLPTSFTRTVQPGENGLVRRAYYVEIVDGVRTEQVAEDIPDEVLREPVAAVVQVGTGEMNTGSGIAGGSWNWPVPEARYSTRGYSSGHKAQDINAPTGTPIYASNGGTVVTADWHWSYGWHVVIDHGNGIQTLYAHCSELFVTEGTPVDGSTMIGLVGSTGSSTGPHCHFEIVIDGVRVDPLGFVPYPF